jgi:hypothetical protein
MSLGEALGVSHGLISNLIQRRQAPTTHPFLLSLTRTLVEGGFINEREFASQTSGKQASGHRGLTIGGRLQV